jgi:hypothetical protein
MPDRGRRRKDTAFLAMWSTVPIAASSRASSAGTAIIQQWLDANGRRAPIGRIWHSVGTIGQAA